MALLKGLRSVLIVDTHAHLYSEDGILYPPTDNALHPPPATGTLNSLMTLVEDNCVSGICAVQPLSFYGFDNSFLCDVSKAHRDSIACVCLLDPDDSRSTQLLERYVTEFGIRGLRSFATDGRLDHPGVRALWGKAEELGLVVSVWLSPDRIDDLGVMASSFPRLPIVVDHCLIAKPNTDVACVLKNFLLLHQFPNVYAKLSFLPLGSTEPYPYRDMHEPCHRIIASFGPEHCVWGNAFPCGLWSPGSTYSQNIEIFTRELDLGDAAAACILGQTANGLWFDGKLTCNNFASRRGAE